MQNHVTTVPLANPANGSLLKRLSLSTFRAVRGVTAQAKEVPGLLAQASQDIKDAWRESSRPNV